MSGFTSPNALSISSRSVSDKTYRFSLSTRSRSARILSCCSDSSPETYKIFCDFPRYAQICSNSVDLPMPGAPPTKTSDPFTPPPPSTRSSSPSPVENRICRSDASSSWSFLGLLAASFVPLDALFAAGFLSSNSTMLFHAPQAGHWPCHLGVSLPHWLQINTLFAFIGCPLLFLNRRRARRRLHRRAFADSPFV